MNRAMGPIFLDQSSFGAHGRSGGGRMVYERAKNIDEVMVTAAGDWSQLR